MVKNSFQRAGVWATARQRVTLRRMMVPTIGGSTDIAVTFDLPEKVAIVTGANVLVNGISMGNWKILSGSENANHITGQTFIVDGEQTMV